MWTNLFYIYMILILQTRKLIRSYFSTTYLDAEYYIDQSNQKSSPDGSKNSPFTTLTQAIDFLQSGDFELILEGTNLVLDSQITIPPGSNYHIK